MKAIFASQCRAYCPADRQNVSKREAPVWLARCRHHDKGYGCCQDRSLDILRGLDPTSPGCQHLFDPWLKHWRSAPVDGFYLVRIHVNADDIEPFSRKASRHRCSQFSEPDDRNPLIHRTPVDFDMWSECLRSDCYPWTVAYALLDPVPSMLANGIQGKKSALSNV